MKLSSGEMQSRIFVTGNEAEACFDAPNREARVARYPSTGNGDSKRFERKYVARVLLRL